MEKMLGEFYGDMAYRLFGQCSVITLTAITVLLVLLVENRKEVKRLKKTAGYVLAVFILVILNPLFYVIADRLGENFEYYRIYWLLLCTAVLAHAFTCLWLHYNTVLKRGILILLFLAVILPLQLYPVELSKADNIYHVGDETAMVAYAIMEDTGKEKLAIVPEKLSIEIRGFEPSIKLLCGTRNAHQYYAEYTKDEDRIYYEVNYAEKPDVKWVGEWVRMYDFVYVVWEKGKVGDGEMEKYLYDKIGETQHYVIYATRNRDDGESAGNIQ